MSCASLLSALVLPSLVDAHQGPGDHRCAVRFTDRKDGGADVVLPIDGREAAPFHQP